MAVIYGIDTNKKVTPPEVRDAVVECFNRAHCVDAGISESEMPVKKKYCEEIVKKAFIDSGGDYDNPSKESILKALDELKKFSANFRDPSIIEKHYREIMHLVNKL